MIFLTFFIFSFICCGNLHFNSYFSHLSRCCQHQFLSQLVALREVTLTRRKTESAVYRVAEWAFFMAELVGFTDVSTDSNSALKSALVQQPISVAIEAGQSFDRLYSLGVLTSSCGSRLNRGVLAVGDRSDADTNDWKVKNSWKGTWCEHGCVRLYRSNHPCTGECCILSGPPSFPVLSDVLLHRVVV